jgi:selenoprotein W-related protein
MPRAVSLTEKILGSLQSEVTSLELVPGFGGVFEVSRDGRKIFSKKEMGRFPEWEEIRAGLR